MNKNIGAIGKRLMAMVGLALVLASQACAEKKLADQKQARAVEAAAVNPAAEKPANTSADSAVDVSRERARSWWF